MVRLLGYVGYICQEDSQLQERVGELAGWLKDSGYQSYIYIFYIYIYIYTLISSFTICIKIEICTQKKHTFVKRFGRSLYQYDFSKSEGAYI